MASKTPRIDNLESLKNIIINGGMDIWQRNITFNSAASGIYTADRFRYDKANTSAVHNIFRSGTIPSLSLTGYQSAYSLSVQIGTQDASLAANEHSEITYRMEGYDLAGVFGQTVRLQFAVLSSVPGTYCIGFRNASGTRSMVKTYTVNQADTYELKTIDLTLDTTGTWNFDNLNGMDIMWTLSAGSDFQAPSLNTWQSGNYFGHSSAVNFNSGSVGAVFRITQVALYKGSFSSDQVIPFRRAGKTFQEELAMCQRYYEKSTGESINTAISDYSFITAKSDTSNQLLSSSPFRVTKRAVPTISLWSALSGTTGQAGVAVTTGAFASAAASSPNTSINSMNYLIGGVSSNGQIATILTAWQADAEL